MKTYEIPDNLLAACISLIERLPAAKDVRSVLNGLEVHMTQQDRAATAAPPDPVSDGAPDKPVKKARKPKGGGGPGEPD